MGTEPIPFLLFIYNRHIWNPSNKGKLDWDVYQTRGTIIYPGYFSAEFNEKSLDCLAGLESIMANQKHDQLIVKSTFCLLQNGNYITILPPAGLNVYVNLE